MKTETKMILGFAVLLIGCTGLILSWGEPSVKIRFTQAEFTTNATTKIWYNYSLSHGAYFRQMSFEDGHTTENVGAAADSFFGCYGGRSLNMKVANLPAPPPSMLITTGKTYYLKVNGRLPIFDFTNNSGVAYRGELSLEHL